MKKREANSNTILNQYLREKRKEGFYCFYELKVATGNIFYFSKIEEGQDQGLPALENEGLVWKFSDEDSRVKPCDGGSFPPLPAYLVIRFGSSFYFIRYSKIKALMATKEKSITHLEAEALADKVFHI